MMVAPNIIIKESSIKYYIAEKINRANQLRDMFFIDSSKTIVLNNLEDANRYRELHREYDDIVSMFHDLGVTNWINRDCIKKTLK